MDTQVSSTSQVSKIKLNSFNFRLEGTKSKAKVPTLGIFSFYDSYSLVPGLSNGRINSTLSNVVTFLHLAEKLRFLFDEMKDEQRQPE